MLIYAIILLTLSVGSWGYKKAKTKNDKIGDFIGFTVLSFVLLFVLVFIPISMYVSIKYKDSFSVIETVTSPIVSVNNNQTVRGEFFLGCGTIGSQEQYFFVRDLGSKRYLRDSFPCNMVVIQESDKAPAFEYDVVQRHNNPVWEYICPKWTTDDGSVAKANYRLVVPPGTIVQRYEIK